MSTDGNGASACATGRAPATGAPSDPVDLLPHRPPFRFVDAVDDLVPGDRVVARESPRKS